MTDVPSTDQNAINTVETVEHTNETPEENSFKGGDSLFEDNNDQLDRLTKLDTKVNSLANLVQELTNQYNSVAADELALHLEIESKEKQLVEITKKREQIFHQITTIKSVNEQLTES